MGANGFTENFHEQKKGHSISFKNNELIFLLKILSFQFLLVCTWFYNFILLNYGGHKSPH
jgi:hypothetical protein